MRTLLVTNRPDRPRFETALVDSILASGDVTKWEVEDGWDLPALTDFDAVVFLVKFRQLQAQSAIDWRGFDGLRVLMDHDSFHDFGGWWGSSLVGAWSTHMPRLRFTNMIVSGVSSLDHFAGKGIDTQVLHKGFSHHDFKDLGRPRSGLGTFGTRYPARRAMLRHLHNAEIPIDIVEAPYRGLNGALNERAAIAVCNMPSRPRFGSLGPVVQRFAPGAMLHLGSAPEPMGKNFEAAAAGCAVFMDQTPDDKTLGFIDGETAIIYRDFHELVWKLDYWMQRPDDLRRIGRASAALCQSEHTWERRADRFQRILNGWYGERP